ncbi:hypothetical protein N7518_002795 [Penicillium psychrosexuale]|nr:hypothetical protein N7518_002795 [Penicillium psychrosexuale]
MSALNIEGAYIVFKVSCRTPVDVS